MFHYFVKESAKLEVSITRVAYIWGLFAGNFSYCLRCLGISKAFWAHWVEATKSKLVLVDFQTIFTKTLKDLTASVRKDNFETQKKELSKKKPQQPENQPKKWCLLLFLFFYELFVMVLQARFIRARRYSLSVFTRFSIFFEKIFF